MCDTTKLHVTLNQFNIHKKVFLNMLNDGTVLCSQVAKTTGVIVSTGPGTGPVTLQKKG